ncbi:hypothetical protein [Vibrio navarrensis]|uniref:hypothetical protein n=1 Tax=Vibrio navarrensis TaxID=29495 RepID=UPI00186878DC|nr:hypothetical protein [Vibrio navarrensis]
MKNQIIGIVGIIAILSAVIWRWESADATLKNVLFYSLLSISVIQNVWFTFKKNKE